jgi:UDP-galactopyranose mutase
MIDEFYGYKFGELEYRTLRFETEDLLQENYQGNAVVNYTDAEIPYTRIIEHKHFEFGCQGGVATDHTVVTREYPAAWKHGDEPYYPMNDEKNNALFAQYKALAESEKNVIFGGRLGMYKYFYMHHVIAEALACAKKEVW